MNQEPINNTDNSIKPLGKKKLTILSVMFIQGAVIVYTMAGVCSKLAGGYDFLAPGFILFYVAQIGVLGIYAILWQQIIKRVDLSVAYVNRSLAILWSMIWAVLFFGEGITVKNVIGVVLVLAGTILVNLEANEDTKTPGGSKDNEAEVSVNE